MVASLLTTAACTRTLSGSFNGAGGRHPWTQPGTLRIATSLSPNTLNPFLSTQQVEALVQAFVLDPLIATDEKGRDVPVLAAAVPSLENGGISRDGLTITYRLRRGVHWHDGAPFTSRDVAFSYRAIMNPATAVSTRHGYDEIARVGTPDPYTAVFRLKRPFAPAVHTFFAHSDAPYYIVPAHVLERYPDLNHIAFNQQPVGTGPFKLVRWLAATASSTPRTTRTFWASRSCGGSWCISCPTRTPSRASCGRTRSTGSPPRRRAGIAN